MRLLHSKFSKQAKLIGVSCACGLFILHNASKTWAVTCPACGAEEDLDKLVGTLLKDTDLETLLADVDRQLEKLTE
jgi:hypothetical protein